MGVDVPFVLANGDIKAGQLIEPITLYLTFVVSNTASPPALPIDATNLQSTEANALTPREATNYVAHDPADIVRSTVVTERGTFTPPTDNLDHPSTHMSSVADPRVDIPSAENALEIANKAVTAINISDTWEGALGRIKWVMDTVSPVSEVRYSVYLCYPLLTRMSSSVESVCEDGVWSGFCDPQGDSFALSSE